MDGSNRDLFKVPSPRFIGGAEEDENLRLTGLRAEI